jgi:hypothetical protein
MSTIHRDDLLDCLRRLEQQRRRCWQEAAQHDSGGTITLGYLGVADGIDIALTEIMAEADSKEAATADIVVLSETVPRVVEHKPPQADLEEDRQRDP